MKRYEFPAYISFGKFDSASTVVELDLTDEEAAWLEACAAEGDFFHLSECKKLGALVDKVFDAADAQLTEELRYSDAELGTSYCSYAENEDDPSEWTVSCTYNIGVNFPEELQDLKSKMEDGEDE